MIFAHWKNMSGTGIEVGGAATPGRGRFPIQQLIAAFVVDIPEGTTQEDVIQKLVAKGILVGNADGYGFEETWPEEVQRQFKSRASSPGVSWSWVNLK